MHFLALRWIYRYSVAALFWLAKLFCLHCLGCMSLDACTVCQNYIVSCRYTLTIWEPDDSCTARTEDIPNDDLGLRKQDNTPSRVHSFRNSYNRIPKTLFTETRQEPKIQNNVSLGSCHKKENLTKIVTPRVVYVKYRRVCATNSACSLSVPNLQTCWVAWSLENNVTIPKYKHQIRNSTENVRSPWLSDYIIHFQETLPRLSTNMNRNLQYHYTY